MEKFESASISNIEVIEQVQNDVINANDNGADDCFICLMKEGEKHGASLIGLKSTAISLLTFHLTNNEGLRHVVTAALLNAHLNVINLGETMNGKTNNNT